MKLFESESRHRGRVNVLSMSGTLNISGSNAVRSGLSEGRGQRQPTTNTKVTVIMRDMGPRNYGEFNEPVFCNEAVLWAVDENGWALLACRSV